MLTNRFVRPGRTFAATVDAKVVCHGQSARSKILEGCDVLADAVGATLGPRGRNVIIQQPYGGPKITKDGVTVARSIELDDPLKDLGASLIKQVAQSANNTSGDGTTTATVLAREIYKGGCEAVAAGLKPVEILKGIKDATAAVLDYLSTNSKPITSRDDLYHVARVSANGDEVIGKLIADAIDRVGRDGVVTVAEGKTINHSVTFSEGYEIARGYVSPYFVTDAKTSKCVMENSPYVLICENKLTNLKSILPALEFCADKGQELLIIADDFEGDVLTTLILNKLRGGLKVCAVKAPSFGDYKYMILNDLGVLCNAKVLRKDDASAVATVEHLGRVTKAVASKEKCLLIGSGGSKAAIGEHVEALKMELNNPETSTYEADRLKERIAKMTSGVAVIHIGGNSEVEVGELKDRVEDALNATRAALLGGVLPGGGSALLFAAHQALEPLLQQTGAQSKDYNAGIEIVRRACETPARQIAQNAGYEGAVIVGNLMRDSKFGEGFDAITGKIVDMYKAGIIDPSMVVKTALRDSSSVASLMCTTEAAVYTKADRKGPASGFPGSNDL